jgi:hypothetical protein
MERDVQWGNFACFFCHTHHWKERTLWFLHLQWHADLSVLGCSIDAPGCLH